MSVRNSFIYGVGSGIGSGTPVRLTSSNFNCHRGVLVKAYATNTSAVYVGDSNVNNSISGNGSNTGFELGPSESTVLPVLLANSLYVIANSGTQKVSFFAT